jgi:hypothetical protein
VEAIEEHPGMHSYLKMNHRFGLVKDVEKVVSRGMLLCVVANPNDLRVFRGVGVHK